MRGRKKKMRPEAWRQRRDQAGTKACKDYTRPAWARKGVRMPDLRLADINAYVTAWDRMSDARRRLFGMEMSNVVRVPSGQWLAKAAAVTGKSVTRNDRGDMCLEYRGLLFMSACKEARA